VSIILLEEQMKKLDSDFSRLVAVMSHLRSPKGCPWDRKQTHKSLLRYLKEESLEVSQAVRRKDDSNLKEELGDVLLQVLFHSQIASERGAFDIRGVLTRLEKKLIGRHPHVFSKSFGRLKTAKDVENRWDEIKRREKALQRRNGKS
jgi:tetrapyrrole methylase family protein/MazG family protein